MERNENDSCKRLFFTQEEKLFLRELKQKYPLLDSKKTDLSTTTEKKRAWMSLTEEFNMQANFTKRTPDQLKKCWENMKNRRRKELTAEKVHRMATGGGPYKQPSEDIVDDALEEAVNIEIMDACDSDTLLLSGTTTSSCEGNESSSCNLMGSEDSSLHMNAADTSYGATYANPIYADSGPCFNSSNTSQRPRKCNIYNTRSGAIEAELQERLDRNRALQEQDKAIFLLRKQVEETNLLISQEKLKREIPTAKGEEEERDLRLKISREVLKQEMLKTQKLLKNNESK